MTQEKLPAETKLLLVPKKALSVADKKKLEKSNYIVIEIDDPENVKVIDRMSFPLGYDADMLLDSALRAIRSIGNAATKEKFADYIISKIAPLPAKTEQANAAQKPVNP